MTITKFSDFELDFFESLAKTTSHVTYDKAQFLNSLGISLTDSELLTLLGAPEGSKVRGGYRPSMRVGSTVLPGGIYFNIKHQRYITNRNIVGICRQGEEMHLFIQHIGFRDTAPSGLGTVMFKRMIRGCLALGIVEVNLLAAGGRLWPNYGKKNKRWGGYYAWARLGFDMPLDCAEATVTFQNQQMHVPLLTQFPFYPSNLARCQTVQSILAKEGGLDWWRSCGTGWKMHFYCEHEHTESVKILNRYLFEKGL